MVSRSAIHSSSMTREEGAKEAMPVSTAAYSCVSAHTRAGEQGGWAGEAARSHAGVPGCVAKGTPPRKEGQKEQRGEANKHACRAWAVALRLSKAPERIWSNQQAYAQTSTARVCVRNCARVFTHVCMRGYVHACVFFSCACMCVRPCVFRCVCMFQRPRAQQASCR